jgi:hypothetical protein
MRAFVVAAGLLLSACTTEGVTPRAPEWSDAPEPAPAHPVTPVEVSWNGISPQVRRAPPLPPRVGTVEVAYEPEAARGLTEVRSVNVRLRVSGIVGQGQVAAEFLAPGPAVYERRTLRVEAEPTEERELIFRLPVAATNIPVHGLSGAWEVRLFLDGAPLTTATFTLER